MEIDAFAPLKLLREWPIVQEDPRVVKLVIEPFLHLAHDTQGGIHLPVACEHEERRIFTSRKWWYLWLRGSVGLDWMRRGIRLDGSVFWGVMEYWGCYVRRAFI